ncbi:MAG: TonB family protein, partial [Myxococcales bacterium]|nr:TonB family protein [Myxococcales bacterium]
MRRPWLSLFALLCAAPAWAQPADEPPAEEQPAAQLSKLPAVLEQVEAVYPPEAQAARQTGEVVLLITIDETGAVADAQVQQSAGNGFDESALTAIKQYRFSPAEMQGEPVAVQILFKIAFTLKEEVQQVEAPVDEKRPTGILRGRLLERGTRAPLAGLQVRIKDGETRFTDAQGGFVFEALPVGEVVVEMRDDIYADLEDAETIEAGKETTVTWYIDKEGFSDTVTVVGRRPRKEVVRRTVTIEEIRTIPGTNGDALQVVQNLPGVARTPFGNADLILRGGGNSQAYLNQQPIPIAFHFGGIRSTVASALIESIDLYPGNYDVEYGRVSGGVVDVRLRKPRTDRVHGFAEADIFDAGALVEGPIGEHAGFAVAVRRSYFDALLAAAPKPEGFTITTAPRWY